MRHLIVVALVCLAGIAGWWLRGLVGPAHGARARTGSTTPAPADAAPPSALPRTPQPQAAHPKPVDPYDAVVAHRRPDETPAQHLSRVLGDDRERAATVLPELLERARREMDERRIQAILELMVATGAPELRALVLEAMVSDDLAFDFAHRDDRFRDLLIDVASADVGEAALRRLRWEFSRGETGDGSVGGYAVLASRSEAGCAFLREMLESNQRGDRRVAVRGLAATGDGAILGELAGFADLEEDHLTLFLRRAGPQGWETLERLATAEETGKNIAEAVACLSARRKRPGTGDLLERLWNGGARRAALDGCHALRPGVIPKDAEERLRDIVFRAIVDEPDGNVRRGAFYAIEYSEVFQTDRARTLLEGIVAGGDAYWVAAARAALRDTEKTLRRSGAQR